MSEDARGVCGVLLAAGAGTRFGGAKLLAPLPADAHGVRAGTPLVLAAFEHLRTATPHVVVVVRPGDPALCLALEQAGARVVQCERASEGMGHSLAAGIAATADAAAWLVALADMPWVDPQTVARLAARLQEGASIVAPRYRGRRGHPVGFAARHRDVLLQLRGDAGARSVVMAHADEVEEVDVDDPGVLRDVDRPEDLAVDAGSAGGRD